MKIKKAEMYKNRISVYDDSINKRLVKNTGLFYYYMWRDFYVGICGSSYFRCFDEYSGSF